MRIISLDLETTGINPQTDQIIQIGMLCFDTETGETFGEMEHLVRHVRYEGDPFALQMNAKLLRRLADGEGIHKNNLRFVVSEFLRDHSLIKPHVVGFNVAPFDLAFLKAADIDLFHHRAIELGTLLMSTTDSPLPVTSNEAMKLLGKDRKVAHTALQDCRDARELYLHARRQWT